MVEKNDPLFEGHGGAEGKMKNPGIGSGAHHPHHSLIAQIEAVCCPIKSFLALC